LAIVHVLHILRASLVAIAFERWLVVTIIPVVGLLLWWGNTGLLLWWGYLKWLHCIMVHSHEFQMSATMTTEKSTKRQCLKFFTVDLFLYLYCDSSSFGTTFVQKEEEMGVLRFSNFF
jgi:hypothetical protein